MERLPIGTILHGHNLVVLPKLPGESANCVVTSPPYWRKRDYQGTPAEWLATHAGGYDYTGKWLGQLGQEPEPMLYIAHLCDIFDEVKRILRDDGVLWVVMGDTMSGSGGDHKPHHKGDDKYAAQHDYSKRVGQPRNVADFPKRCQCCIPERFSLEMINRGWIRHSTCIWHKTNPKPESANTRFTNDFEYVYMFTKNSPRKIFFDTQYEPAISVDDRRCGKGRIEYDGKHRGQKGTGERAFVSVDKLRRMRTTFNLPLQPFTGAHFAVFPEKLIEPLIRATCPLAVCSKCGRPRREIYEAVKVKRKRLHDTTDRGAGDGLSPNDYAGSTRKFTGYDFCSCGASLRKGVVFDPFMGAGTTALVAEKLKRGWCGVEINKSFIRMSYRRLAKWTK